MKNFCKIIVLIVLIMCLSSCSLQSSNAGLKLELNENGTYYRVVGILNSANRNVVVPEIYKGLPVKEVSDYAFDGCTNIETVSIPESVITVGNSAFYGCDNLISISMPGVVQMDKGAFTGCTTIEELTIPANFAGYVKSQPLKSINITCGETTSVSASVFLGHESLEEVTISKGITEIGEKAFSECTLLKSVSLPQGLQVIASNAFSLCPLLNNIVLPAGIENIYSAAFARCTSLTDIVIPGSVHLVGDAAFYKCSALQQVIIENGVTRIGSNDDLSPGAFEDCQIEGITIPKSVTYINQSSFTGNPLERAIFENANDWKIGHSMNNLLAEDIFLNESDMADKEYAASVLLKLSGSKYNYMSCE